jgi:hypothetical protein
MKDDRPSPPDGWKFTATEVIDLKVGDMIIYSQYLKINYFDAPEKVFKLRHFYKCLDCKYEFDEIWPRSGVRPA